MGDIERIQVKKVYLGSAAKFGILYGLVLGILAGVVLAILYYSKLTGNIGIYGLSITSNIWMDIGIFSLSILLFMFIISIFSSIFYSIVSALGGSLHVGLVEVGETEPVKTTPSNQTNRQVMEKRNADSKSQVTVNSKSAGVRLTGESAKISSSR